MLLELIVEVLLFAVGLLTLTPMALPAFPLEATVIALAAVTAAFIAAVTAQRRHVAELGHDRGMRDLEELRRILDEAALLASEGVEEVEALFFVIRDSRGKRTEAFASTKRAVARMKAMDNRLRLRLGGDSVVGAYWLSTLRLEQALEILEAGLTNRLSPESVNVASERIDLHKQAFNRFMEFGLARSGIDAAGPLATRPSGSAS
jgi:hypothetical protein